MAVVVVDAIEEEESESRYRTTLTSLASFHHPYKGRFRLVVTKNGQVLGASWHAAAHAVTTIGGGDSSSSSSSSSATVAGVGGSKRGRKGEFDLLVERQGPRPVLEKFIIKGQPTVTVNEEGEEVVEKTLFQR